MIYAPLFHLLTSLLNGLFAALPPWTFAGLLPASGPSTGLGGPSGDGGALTWFLQLLRVLDRYLPIHDALVPIVSVSLALAAALMAFKAIKFLLSLIPTVSAGG